MVWFDAFRSDLGPTWYGDNRTPVITDTVTVTILLVFLIFLVAFLVIFPGVRRERWSSFFSVTLTLAVGAVILVCIHHPCWFVGKVRIFSTYRAFTGDKLKGVLGIRVGLKNVNITLRGWPETSADHHLDYNERFDFREVRSLERELANGLHKGLPYPILSVIEYLSVDRAGFVWGRQFRLAGYYTCILLWLSLSLWILQVLMLCLVPQYFSRALLLVGASIELADLVYFFACPKLLRIPFPDADGQTTILQLHFGWCFWATIGAGGACLLFGLVIRFLEAKSLYYFVTFLQADFDEVSSSPRGETRARVDSQTSVQSFPRNASVPPEELEELEERRGSFLDSHSGAYVTAAESWKNSETSKWVSTSGKEWMEMPALDKNSNVEPPPDYDPRKPRVWEAEQRRRELAQSRAGNSERSEENRGKQGLRRVLPATVVVENETNSRSPHRPSTSVEPNTTSARSKLSRAV